MNEERVRYLLDEVWDPGEASDVLRAWVSENVVDALEFYRKDLVAWLKFSEGSNDVALHVSSSAGRSEMDDPWEREFSLRYLFENTLCCDDLGMTEVTARRLAERFDDYAAQMRGLADRISMEHNDESN